MEHTEVRYLEGMKFIAQNRKHSITIDLPKEIGGQDSGPTPPEVFISSLGSCMGVYVLMFCRNAGLNTKGLKISLDWEKTMEKPARIKSISAKIELPNADIGARKAALLKVAESCLIHETIKNQPKITIDIV